MALTRSQKAERASNDAIMMIEGMTDLSFDALCDIFAEHLTHRADVDPAKLDDLGNRLSRMAWEAQRA